MTDRLDANAAAERLAAAPHLNLLTHEPHVEGPTAPGPLDGLAVLIKANIAIGGAVWDGACPALSDVVAQADAGAVARLRAAGASVTGHANCHELAFGITSDNAHFGPVKNPHDPSRMAGGSSGGSAAAVAAGAVSAALGTDTGGSGRIPAAFCGCVGFRPSTGRYQSDGVLTLSESFDTVTPFARTVGGVAALDAVLAGDTAATPPQPLSGRRIGILRDPFWTNASAGMAAAVKDALAALEREGAVLVELEADGAEISGACAAVALPLVLAETAAFWGPFLQKHRGMTIAQFAEAIASPDVAGVFGMVASGPLADGEAIAGFQQKRQATASRLASLIETHDLAAIAHPATAVPAPPLTHSQETDVDGATHPLFPLLTDARLVASVTAMPALTVPAGVLGQTLPFAVEFFGARGADRSLLALGAEAEAVWGAVATPAL